MYVFFFITQNVNYFNKVITNVCLQLHKTLLFNRFTNFRNLLVSYKNRRSLNWMSFSRKRFKFFKKSLKIYFFKNKFFKKKDTVLKKIKSIVRLKKKTSMFKKKDKIEFSFLKRLNMFRFKKNKLLQIFKKTSFKRKYLKSKYVDLFRRTSLIWFYNRIFLKNFFRFNKFRQWSLTRVFASLIKTTPKRFLHFLESSVSNIMILSKFVFTLKEARFLVNSGLVFINGLPCRQEHALVNVGDVVQIGLSNKFFKFYRFNYQSKTRIFRRISYRLWLLGRFKWNFYKQSTTKIPSWINTILFVYEDVPYFLEIDYIILTVGLIFNPNSFEHFNFFNKKVVNLFLLRLYNWKYIT